MGVVVWGAEVGSRGTRKHDIFLTVGGRGNAERETVNGKSSPGGHLNYRLLVWASGLKAMERLLLHFLEMTKRA